MGFKDIAFNPYQENHDYIVNAIEEYLVETQPELVLEELAQRVFFDNSIGWSTILPQLFAKHDLSRLIPNHFRNIVRERRTELIPQYTYFITSLISSRLLSVEFLDNELITEIQDAESKYILFSFLASWDLQRALELDRQFTINNFRSMVEVSKVPTKNLILNAEDESVYKLVQNVLTDSNVQFHFYQTIQKIIKGQDNDELQKLERFIDRCFADSHEHMIDFVSDLLELTTIQEFLRDRWNFILIEKPYRNFAQNQAFMSSVSKRTSLNALNRLKGRQKSNFAIAARHKINRLSEKDRQVILKYVEEVASSEITDFEVSYSFSPSNGWEWRDYAHALVRYYKDNHKGEHAVNVVRLGEELGFNILVTKLQTEEFDACLVRDVTLKLPIIIVNSTRKSTGRINFSIAHEIAHAVIPHHSKGSFFCFLDDVTENSRFVMNKQLEREANEFASYVLLPDRDFKQDCLHLDFNMKNVSRLSKKYGASLVLVAKRWVEISNLEIGMVFSTNGVVDWACTSETFPFKWVSHVDKSSTVFDAIELEERRPISKGVHSTQWFDTDYPRYILQEESYRIFDNKVLTLLQILDDE